MRICKRSNYKTIDTSFFIQKLKFPELFALSNIFYYDITKEHIFAIFWDGENICLRYEVILWKEHTFVLI